MKITRLLCLAITAFVSVVGATRAAPMPAKSDEDAIRKLDTRWGVAAATKNVDLAVSLYASDAIVLDPDEPAHKGVAAIRAAWNGIINTPGLAITITPEKIEITGDVAMDFGRFDLEFDTSQGHQKQTNKYLTIWRKIDGQWKVAYDAWNTNVPSAK